MTRETVVAYPGGIDFHLYPSNPTTVRAIWPDDLTGRTFEVRLHGIEEPVDVDVVDEVMTWTFPTATDGTSRRWELWDTTDDAPVPVEMGGTALWIGQFDNTADEQEVTVLVSDTIGVTVQAGSLVLSGTIDGGAP